jgi:ADP-heptose:LPS heptosyltransferase
VTPSPAESLPGELLVVRTGAIGDVVNALVFAGAIRELAPNTRIGWVVHPLSAPLLEAHPWIDRVHLWRKQGGVGELRRVARELRTVGYSLAVDLQRIQKSALLAKLSGARRRLGFDRARTKEFAWLWSTERMAPGPDHEHMLERYAAAARHLGWEGEPRRELPRDPGAAAWAAERLAECSAPPTLLNLGASKPANRWEPERWGELARRLADEGPVVLTGGPGDREAADRALAAAGGAPVIDWVGASSLLELIALCRVSRRMVTCDTGPMHIAAAVGLPVAALFGPADPRRTGPWGVDRDGHPHRVLVAAGGDMGALGIDEVARALSTAPTA